MASFLPKNVQKLIEELSRLPGIGPKSAQRLTMHLLYSPEQRAQQLADAINYLKTGLKFCQVCWNIAENDLCGICADQRRRQEQICVVEDILDVVALEKTTEYHGTYHVLHGVLSPVDGIGPEELKIQALVDRIHAASSKDFEIILATNPGMEGETTAMYLLRILKPMGVRITRIARGLPAGGDLDYADELTLARAIQGRADYS
jgi:recombination protein RecR